MEAYLDEVAVRYGYDSAAAARRDARAVMDDILSRCTPLRWVVTVILFCFIVGYSVALHMIYRAAHTPELSTVESPRTSWSSKRAGQIGRWFDWQQQLAVEAANYQPSSPYDARARIVLLGDSITEAWRGSSYGEPRIDRAELPDVLQETLAQRWPSPLVLGISGDQTQHLLWRIAHGEISQGMADDPRLLVVVLIGTNNLAAGHSPEEVADGIHAVTERLLNSTRGRVLVNAVFPRGDGLRAPAQLCPPRCAKNGRPLRSFRPSIDRVNYLLNRSIQSKLQRDHPDRLRFIDCGRHLLGGLKAGGNGGGGGGGGGSGGTAPLYSAERLGLTGRRLDGPDDPVLRAVDRAVNGVNEVVGGATRDASDLLAAGAEYLTRGGPPSDDVRTELFMPDKLHPNAEGHRRWANCLEAEIGSWDSVGAPRV